MPLVFKAIERGVTRAELYLSRARQFLDLGMDVMP